MSQTRLGEAAGVSQSHISHMERGEEFPSCELTLLLASALGLPQIVGAITAGYVTDLDTDAAELASLLSTLTGERKEIARGMLVMLAGMESRGREARGRER